MDAAAPVAWIPLSKLGDRLAANLQALSKRYPDLASSLQSLSPTRTYFIQPQPDRVLLGTGTAGGIQTLPQPLPPPAARDITNKLFASGNCDHPVVVAGEDLGWLWNYLFQLPCKIPTIPGHSPPLFFLIREMERLWAILHIQEWRTLLADSRVRLFAGPDCFDQFRQSLATDLMCPWPRQLARIDASLWPAGTGIDEVLNAARLSLAQRLTRLTQQTDAFYSNTTPSSIVERLQSGASLNVLGVTSRYTTFLQHSMRDWLAAFERLGHRTQLLIESADHEVPNTLATATVCAQFKPDLIVVIDHYRKEVAGLPSQVPVVMWVQDALPNIFCRAGGEAQGERDYALGFARLRMIHEFGYPASRYMTAIVALNDERFSTQPLSASDQSQFGCDVSFVSHASTPAEALVNTEITRIGSPEARRLLWGIYEKLKAVYDTGEAITEPNTIRGIIDQVLLDTRTGLPDDQMPTLMDLFVQKVNNSLFRHQSLNWLADLDIDLRLYGRGWEQHPTLGRFARGIADNATQLSTIYRASKINLQISPHGAVHQRLLEGVAAGGFFLLRHCPGDVIEREFQAIWDWCRVHSIRSDSELRQRATADVQLRLDVVGQILQRDPFAMEYSFIEMLQSSEESGYIRSAATIWPDDYDSICFRSQTELRKCVSHYLQNEKERQARAQSMRKPVLDRFTYLATSRRLIEFIAADQAAKSSHRVAA